MKTKLVLLLALLCWGGFSISYAQITTGKPSSKVIRTGNRAQAGDFGIYLGATSDMVQAFDKNVNFSALPLINFKYMVTNQLEARLGLELYKTSKTLKGEVEVQSITGDNTVLMPSSWKDSRSNAMLYPGIAYHFSSRNLLDVYVGAELPLGWDSTTEGDGGYELEGEQYIATSTLKTKRAFVIGLGAFVGIQAYIADLPLALGAEFGISSRFDTGVKYKTVTTTGNETQTYYQSALEFEEGTGIPGAANIRYDSLKARMGEIGGQIRLTLTYYFK